MHRALEDLRREDDRLLAVLEQGSRRVKELGDVQNWAERLERDFLVLEETVRLVERGQRRRRRVSGSGSEGSWSGSDGGSGSYSGSSGSWSGSEAGSEEGSVAGDVDGDVQMGDVGASSHKGKGRQEAMRSDDDAMDVDPAEVPLPADDGLETGRNLAALNVAASEQPVTAAQPSPGGTSWFKRFIWRS